MLPLGRKMSFFRDLSTDEKNEKERNLRKNENISSSYNKFD